MKNMKNSAVQQQSMQPTTSPANSNLTCGADCRHTTTPTMHPRPQPVAHFMQAITHISTHGE